MSEGGENNLNEISKQNIIAEFVNVASDEAYAVKVNNAWKKKFIKDNMKSMKEYSKVDNRSYNISQKYLEEFPEIINASTFEYIHAKCIISHMKDEYIFAELMIFNGLIIKSILDLSNDLSINTVESIKLFFDPQDKFFVG
ncbi:unnamed protein product [Adineta steineri]|uniref:Uncharacterized protein n=1 Tax=Adineta steineri TaxID=433720 RepID=A0A813RV13_9BILA|nr:unnamed protein product [Adineta steineri]